MMRLLFNPAPLSSASRRMLCLLCALSVSSNLLAATHLETRTEEQATDQPSEPTRLQQLHYGQVLYQLYQGDHQRSLQAIALAETLGIPDARLTELQLLKSGVSLAYGLTQEAENLFDQFRDESAHSHSALRLKARYWLAVTHFHQGRWQKARLPVPIFTDLIQSDSLTDEQKSTLAYQQAYLATLEGDENLAFTTALAPDGLETQYLGYNRGVRAFAEGEFAEAEGHFQTTLTGLSQAPKHPFNWLGWLGFTGIGNSTDASNPRLKERQALTNQASYALGQSQLAQQAFIPAMGSFGQIEQASPLAAQALLELGQAHANADQWPQAMALWQYLVSADGSFAALQAMRAMAYGFEVLEDEVQAMQSLEGAEVALLDAQAGLAQLKQMPISEVLSASLQLDQPAPQWPERHRDIQLTMLSGDNARWLEQLQTLNEQQNRLARRLDTLKQFEQLLAEREQEHKRRAASIADMDLKGPLADAGQQLTAMKNTLAAIVPAQLASTEQARWLQRVARAEQTLMAIEVLKPEQKKLRARLERVQGILNWQLEEAFVPRRWQHHQSLAEAESTYAEALQGYQNLQAAFSHHRTVDADRSRLLALKNKVGKHLGQAALLAGRVETVLKSNFDALLAWRQTQLDTQLYHTRLAKLRLQDGNSQLNDGEQRQTLMVQEDGHGR